METIEDLISWINQYIEKLTKVEFDTKLLEECLLKAKELKYNMDEARKPKVRFEPGEKVQVYIDEYKNSFSGIVRAITFERTDSKGDLIKKFNSMDFNYYISFDDEMLTRFINPYPSNSPHENPFKCNVMKKLITPDLKYHKRQLIYSDLLSLSSGSTISDIDLRDSPERTSPERRSPEHSSPERDETHESKNERKK
jgi:hypothetical protein